MLDVFDVLRHLNASRDLDAETEAEFAEVLRNAIFAPATPELRALILRELTLLVEPNLAGIAYDALYNSEPTPTQRKLDREGQGWADHYEDALNKIARHDPRYNDERR